MKLKIVLYGIGQIMQSIVDYLLKKKDIEIVGAVDIDPAKVGKDLSDVLKLPAKIGVRISNDPHALLSATKPDIVIHATTSYLEKIYPQIVEIVEHNANVISTAEELVYPYVTSPSLSRTIDKMAKAHGVTVLGTGIAPGYLHDTLVIVLTTICQRIDKIKVTTVSEASLMRYAFQKKIGAGMTPEEFRQALKEGRITLHVGLRNSMAMIADALGLELDTIEELQPEPITAKEVFKSEFIEVKPGNVAGVRQYAHGLKDGKEIIVFDFQSYIGAGETYNEILIEGKPSFKVRPDFILGRELWTPDMGTAAMIVNSIPKVLEAPPGLITMKDLSLPHTTLENLNKYTHKFKVN
jgi:4-hydroxy-tetrahydrodipicolinate reductase